VNHLDPRPRQRDSLADANPPLSRSGSRFTRYAAYIVMAWLLAISASLITQGLFFDIAVRDIELSLGAFVLAKLTEVCEMATLEDSPRRDLTTAETTKTLRHVA
jgi:hypothetical protein